MTVEIWHLEQVEEELAILIAQEIEDIFLVQVSKLVAETLQQHKRLPQEEKEQHQLTLVQLEQVAKEMVEIVLQQYLQIEEELQEPELLMPTKDQSIATRNIMETIVEVLKDIHAQKAINNKAQVAVR